MAAGAHAVPAGDGPDLILRPEVSLERHADELHIGYGLWEVSLPAAASPSLAGLVTERCLRGADVDAATVTLLAEQGCFLPPHFGELAMRDVVAHFLPIRSQLYASYYAHPVWQRLRTGQASKAELLAWVVHNYHISRSAGPIAARQGVHARDAALAEFFRTDALEEYWHCDAFYFVQDAGLTLDAERVKAYVPLPASTAFEELALVTAATDPLGHLLIAYFQESSILFRRDSDAFYDDVERHYGLDGFFAGWRRHMTLDLEHGHADGLRELFESDRLVPIGELARAVRCVQLAQYFLGGALDEVGAYSDFTSDALDHRQPGALTAAAADAAAGPSPTPDPAAARQLAWALHRAAFGALAQARRHDDIMAAGRLADALERLAVEHRREAADVRNPWVTAVVNFLHERAGEARLLALLAGDVLEAVTLLDPQVGAGLVDLRERVAAAVEAAAPSSAANQIERTRLRELLERCYRGEALAPVALCAAEPPAG